MPSMMLAWLSLSERMTSPLPIKAAITPRLAIYPVLNSTARAVPFQAATSSSTCWCRAKVPTIRRDAVLPAPQRAAASWDARIKRASWASPR